MDASVLLRIFHGICDLALANGAMDDLNRTVETLVLRVGKRTGDGDDVRRSGEKATNAELVKPADSPFKEARFTPRTLRVVHDRTIRVRSYLL
jgi:hypothetical protein